MKKTTFNRVLLSLIVCLVMALSCFTLTLLPKPAVAQGQKTVVAGTDFTLSGTPADGVSIVSSGEKFGAVQTPTFMAGTDASPKIFINGFSRMRATVVNFTEPVDVNVYDTFSTEFTITASNINMIFAFYRNESGVVVGQTDNAGTFVSTSAPSGTRLALNVSLKPLADEDGFVSSFILVHVYDTRIVNSADADFDGISFSMYDGVLTTVSAVDTYTAGTNFFVTDKSLAQNADGVTYPSKTGIGVSGNSIYVNQFKRLCATVVYLTTPISVEDTYSITVAFSKAMGNATTFDFYPNVESVVVGNLNYSKHSVTSRAANGVQDTTTIRVADLAKDGYISSFVIVHTSDEREDDYGMTFKLFTITTTSIASVATDNVLAMDGVDMVNGTSNATNNVDFVDATSVGKMYANNLLKGYATTVKFGTPIDINIWKTLDLRLNMLGVSNKYTYYLDLYKAGATDFTHAGATARYTIFNSRDDIVDEKFVSSLIINLPDFANANGLVESITIVHYDNSGDNVNAGNLSVYESYLDTKVVDEFEINGGEYTVSLPEKTAENKAFIGWEIGGKLYAPFTKYTGETATAKPVYFEFFMQNAASIRVTEPVGLRFGSYISASDLEYLESISGYVNLFTWITSPGSTSELEILRVGSWIEQGDLVRFNGTMVGIKEIDYTRTFIGRSYVEISYEGDALMRVLSVGSHVERNISDMAKELLNKGAYDDVNIVAILEKFAGIA